MGLADDPKAWEMLNKYPHLRANLTETLIDHFGYVKVAQGASIWEDKRLFEKGAKFYEDIISGTASSTFVSADSAVRLSIGTTTGDSIARQAWRRSQYISGNTQEIEITGNFESNPDTATLKTVVRKNGVDSVTVSSDFNKDTYTSFDASKFQLFRLAFQWLGGGTITFSKLAKRHETLLHEEYHANLVETPYMRVPSQPIRYELIHNGTSIIKRMGYYDDDDGIFFEVEDTDLTKTTMLQICSSVSSIGDYALQGLEFSCSVGITPVSLSAGVRTPILAMRLKSQFNGLQNKKLARFLHSHLLATGNNVLFEVAHVHDATLATGTPVDANVDSVVEYIISPTFTGAVDHVIHPIYVLAGQAGKGGEGSSEIDYVSKHNYISNNHDGTKYEYMVIYGTAMGGAADAYATLDWIEFE